MNEIRPYQNTRENQQKTTYKSGIFMHIIVLITTFAALFSTDITLNAAYVRGGLTAEKQRQSFQDLLRLIQTPIDIYENNKDAADLENIINKLTQVRMLDQNLEVAARAHAKQLAQGNPAARQALAQKQQQLQAQQQTFTQQQQQAQQNLQQQQLQLQQLQQQLDAARAQLAQAPKRGVPIKGAGPSQAEIDALQRIDQLNQALQTSNNEITQLRAQNAALQQKGGQPAQQIPVAPNLQLISLRKELDTQQQALAQRDAENAQLTQANQQQVQDIGQLQAQIDALQQLPQEMQALRQQLSQYNTDNTQLQTEMSALREMLKQANITIGSLQAAKGQEQGLLAENTTLRSNLDSLTQQNQQQTQTISQLQAEISNLRRQHPSQEIKSLQDKIAQLEQERQQVQNQADLQVANKQLEIENLKTSNAELVADNAQLMVGTAGEARKSMQLEDQLAQSEKRATTLETELRTSAQTCEALKGQLKGAEASAEELANTKTALQAINNKAKELAIKLTDQERKTENINSEYAKALEKLRQQQTEIDTLKKQLGQPLIPRVPVPPAPSAPMPPIHRPSAPKGVEPLKITPEEKAIVQQAIKQSQDILTVGGITSRLAALSYEQLDSKLAQAYIDIRKLDKDHKTSLGNLPLFSFNTYKSFLGILNPIQTDAGLMTKAISFMDTITKKALFNKTLSETTTHLREFSTWMLELPTHYNLSTLNTLKRDDIQTLENFLNVLAEDVQKAQKQQLLSEQEQKAKDLFLNKIFPWANKIMENLQTSNMIQESSAEEKELREIESGLGQSIILRDIEPRVRPRRSSEEEIGQPSGPEEASHVISEKVD